MKIGILQCDSVLPEYQNDFGDYPDMFIQLLSMVEKKLEFKIYDVRKSEFPEDINECDGYITTGSKLSVYEHAPWYPAFENCLKNLIANKKKLICVCFGHQFLADSFSGKTLKSDKGWGVGVATNKILHHKHWMQPILTEINVVVSHQDQVETLPEGAQLLASSEFCPNFMYQISDNVLSMQGHPEFSKQYSDTLMRHRKDIIGTNTFEAAQQSLEKHTDELIIANWILNFIEE